MLVLGCDPGDSSFGMCLLNINKNISIEYIGMNTKIISNLTSNTKLPARSKRKKKQPDIRVEAFIDQLDSFKLNFKRFLKTYNVDTIATERFMTRGIKGKSIECVSMMNGVLASLSTDKGIPFILYSAAGWKNSINKIVDLKSLYKDCRLTLKPHEVDASFIALAAFFKTQNIHWASPKCKEYVYSLQKRLISYEKVQLPV